MKVLLKRVSFFFSKKPEIGLKRPKEALKGLGSPKKAQ